MAEAFGVIYIFNYILFNIYIAKMCDVVKYCTFTPYWHKAEF